MNPNIYLQCVQYTVNHAATKQPDLKWKLSGPASLVLLYEVQYFLPPPSSRVVQTPCYSSPLSPKFSFLYIFCIINISSCAVLSRKMKQSLSSTFPAVCVHERERERGRVEHSPPVRTNHKPPRVSLSFSLLRFKLFALCYLSNKTSWHCVSHVQ